MIVRRRVDCALKALERGITREINRVRWDRDYDGQLLRSRVCTSRFTVGRRVINGVQELRDEE